MPVSTWSAAGFVRRLAEARIGSDLNFFADGGGAEMRRTRLAKYWEPRRTAGIILVGEAAGYRGARLSGIPFTSERQLTGSGPGGAPRPGVDRARGRLALVGA